MSKYFDQEILDELEKRYDSWSKNPPKELDTIPDGGIFLVFVSDNPNDVVTDDVFEATMNEIFSKPENCLENHLKELREKHKDQNSSSELGTGCEVAQLPMAETFNFDFNEAMAQMPEFQFLFPVKRVKELDLFGGVPDSTLKKIIRHVVNRPPIRPPIFGPSIDEPLTVMAYYSYRLSSWIIKAVTKKTENTNQLTES